MPAFVIKTWKVNSEPDANGNYIDIKGRAPGLISWLLATMGVEPTVSIQVSEKNYTFKSGSLAGQFSKTIPLTKISSVYHGYAKPWKEAVSLFFVLGVVLGVPTFGVTTVLALIIAPIYYFLNKKLTLGVFEIGGMISGMDIKRSVIEGRKLDQEDAEQVGEIIRMLIESKN